MPTELSDIVEPIAPPTSESELAESIRTAHDESTPIYISGGGTGLHGGLPPSKPGWGISTTQLNQIVDYPAADMTITVGAGITIKQLQETLRAQQQQLPLDVAHTEQATLGGVLATNRYGHRRFGYGSARDYVIGIRAVDGRGSAFAGGGRVVKNVAGYDFCKLLVGSYGSLGIITQVTLKLKPLAAARAAVLVPFDSYATAETVLANLVHSNTQPIAISWLYGSRWDSLQQQASWPTAEAGHLFVLYEGTATEVDWCTAEFASEIAATASTLPLTTLVDESLDELETALASFGARREAALIAKASLLPSEVVGFVRKVREATPDVSLLAHAGNGLVLVESNEYPEAGVGATLTNQWQPWASHASGNVCVLHNRDYQEATVRTSWGTPTGPTDLMRRIKEQFDPRAILNPGRFLV